MGVSIEHELNVMDRAVTALRVDYERFFGGELKRPPVQERRRVVETLRRLENLEVDRAAERFRLQALQSRLNSFAELWDKRLQAREEGRRVPGRQPVPSAPPAAGAGPADAGRPKAAVPPDVAALVAAAEAAAARGATAGAPPPDAPAGASVKPRSRVDFTPLFRRYVAAREALGEDVSKLKYEKFEEAVRRQADEIRRKTGSSRLVFEVQTTSGRVRLVGRPAAPGSKG